MPLEIKEIYGNCPVQAEGIIDGQPFYFRARGQHWSFGVGADPIGEPNWRHDEPWGEGPFDAGWMTEAQARQLIDKAAALYRAHKAEKNLA